MKIHAVVCVEDEMYLEMLTHFVRNSEYANRIALHVCSNPDYVEQHVSLMPNGDILVMEPATSLPGNIITKFRCVFLLAEDITEQEQVLADGYIQLFKYQPLPQLFGQLVNMYYEQSEKAPVSGEHSHTKIVACYSASGGSGKTIVSYLLARQLALQGCKVMYLNIEQIGSAPVWLPHESTGESARLLYYLKTRNDKSALRINRMVKRDSSARIHYLELHGVAREMTEMDGEDTRYLIDTLSESGNYDFILIDIGCYLNEQAVCCLHASDAIIWIICDEIQAMHKADKAMALLKSAEEERNVRIDEKTHYVLNKFTGSMTNGTIVERYPLAAYLPYIPEWKSASLSADYTDCHRFNEQLLKLAHTLNLTGIREGALSL